jgi:hypothetical protein
MSKKAIWTIIIILVLIGLWWVLAASNDGDDDVEEMASVVASDQAPGEVLVMERVVLREGGFVVVRNDAGEVVGSSEYRDAGTYEGVEVTLVESSEAGDRYEVVLYSDADGDREFNSSFDMEVTQESGGSAGGDVSGGVVSDFIVIIGDFEADDDTATTTDEEADDSATTSDGGAGAEVDTETDGSLDSGLY